LIYLDSSVALAEVLDETRQPPDWLWDADLASSLLLKFELWNRAHAYDLAAAVQTDIETIQGQVHLDALDESILLRALRPFPVHVRTLGALHLATAHYLIERFPDLRLATYDQRMADAALALGIPLVPLE
jgi:hypothetical protein